MSSKYRIGDMITANKKQYFLGEKIGTGAEGNVYKIKDLENFVVKILRTSDDPEKDNRKRLILNRLIAKDIDQSSTCLIMPRVALDPPELGYIMPYYDDSISLSEFLSIDPDIDFVENYLKGTFGFRKRLRTAAILFNALHHIHLEGLTFVDISPNNILVREDKWGIAFIDTDNLVVGNYEFPEVLGTPRYIAPEVLNKTSSATQESDVFSMAAIIFELLTFYHPFVGEDIMQSGPDEEQEAYKGNRDYLLLENSKATMKNTICADVFLSEKLKILFHRTFVEGLRDKFARPTAREYALELKQIYNDLITCQNDQCGIDYPMFYGKECPNCNTINKIFSVNYMLKTIDGDEIKSDSLISRKVITIKDNIDENDKRANSVNLYFHDFIPNSEHKKAFANVKVKSETHQAEFAFRQSMLKEVKVVDRENSSISIEARSFVYDYIKKDIIIKTENFDLQKGKRELVYYVRVQQEY